MKKIIIAAALILTTGLIATNTKTVKVIKGTTTTLDKSVVATSD